MNKFKYNFSKVFYIVAGVGSAVAIACIVINALRYSSYIEKNIELGFYNYLTLIFTAVLSVAFLVIIISALISSNYTVFSEKVVLRWGIIKNTVKLSEVKRLKLCTDTGKLLFVFDDDGYFIIVINSNEYEKFVDEVKKVKPNIPYMQGVTE